MIVPRNRLILWAGIVFVPAALAAAIQPNTAVLALCGALSLLVLAAIDAFRSLSRLDFIQVTFNMLDGGKSAGDSPVFRMTKDRAGEVQLRIVNTSAGNCPLRLGLEFPPHILSDKETLSLVVPQSHEGMLLRWECVPRRRGKFLIDNIYVETPSPWGFWDYRRVMPGQAELRVYPNLAEERHRMAAVFLHRGNYGIHAQRRVGLGREFEKLRDYLPGDSIEDIHWKATARRAHPVTKVYQIERTQEVYVLIDASRLSDRISIDPQRRHSSAPAISPLENAAATQLDRFIKAALLLGLVAEKQGDLFGLITYSDRVHGFIRAGAGREHFGLCRDLLYTLEAQAVNPDFGELCSFVHARLRRRALLIILTNLDDPVLAERFAQNVRLLHRKHLVLVNMITPRGAGPIFHGPEVRSIGDVYHQLSGHLQWRDLRELQLGLHRLGVDMHLLSDAALAPELVSQYVNVKQRQRI